MIQTTLVYHNPVYITQEIQQTNKTPHDQVYRRKKRVMIQTTLFTKSGWKYHNPKSGWKYHNPTYVGWCDQNFITNLRIQNLRLKHTS